MKIFTIFKCLIRFLNLLFTILKFSVDMMSVMWRKFPLTEWSCPATQQQGIIRCRAGVGGQGSRAAMESPKALMCPLEKGVRGIEISKSSQRQPCCCCPVTVQKEQQGIIRCRAGVGGQGSLVAMESPEALMCPLEKGDRGIETGHQMPGRSWRAGKAMRRWKARRP